MTIGRLLAAPCLVTLTGCLAPPALLDPIQFAPDRLEQEFPPGIERVEVPVGSRGARLRGVFVPADPGAPVVLQLQESSLSVATRGLGYGPLAREMADLGLATLVCDWRGVGLSSGSRSVDHIAADARVLWDEAVRRAGGDPRRVVLRGASLGTIGAAELLRAGVEPGVLVLVAPVRPASAARRFAWHMYGAPTGLVASAVFRGISDADPITELRRVRVPALIAPSRNDFFLVGEDLDEIRSAALESGARLLVMSEEHAFASLAGHHVLRPDEEDLLRAAGLVQPDVAWRMERLMARLDPAIAARFAPGSAEHERLAAFARRQVHTPAPWLAAAALSGWDAARTEHLLRTARSSPRLWHAIDFDLLLTVFDLEDPAGPIDPREIAEWMRELPFSVGSPEQRHLGVLDSLEKVRAGLDGPQDPRGAPFHIRVVPGEASATFWSDVRPLWASIQERVAERAGAERILVRTLLKAWRHCPDRVVAGPDGAPELQVHVDGAWLPLEEAAALDARALAVAAAASRAP